MKILSVNVNVNRISKLLEIIISSTFHSFAQTHKTNLSYFFSKCFKAESQTSNFKHG